MDARNLHKLALKTSEHLTKALQFNRDVLDALQTLTAKQYGQQLQSQSTALSPEAPGQEETDLQRQSHSDFVSLSSSAPTLNSSSNAKPRTLRLSDRDWLLARPADKQSNSSSAQLEPKQVKQQNAQLLKPAKEAVVASSKLVRKCPSWEYADTTSSARRTTQDDLQVNTQSTWEKAQNRFLSAIVGGDGKDGGKGGAQRKLRRSLSMAAGDSRQRQKQQQQQHKHRHHRDAIQQAAKQPVSPSRSKRNDSKKSLTTSASADPLTPSLASSQQLKPPPRRARSKPKAAKTARSSGTDGHAASAAADGRQREVACLQAVDCLLQVCRQAIGHPSLASAYADTLSRLARDLLRRLDPYRLEADRPFHVPDWQLQQAAEALQTVAESNITDLTRQQLGSLVEWLSWLQTRLQFYLRPEAVLPTMEPAQRLRYFSEYCSVLLEDCERIVQQQAARAAESHSAMLLTVMRYFVGNQHLFSSGGDSGLLMRCYERLEQLQEGGGAAFEQRLRQQSKEFRSDLRDLCELLIQETEQQTGRGQQQQPPPGGSASPGSRDARSKSSTQQSLAAEHRPTLSVVCVSADRIIRHLKRLVEAPIATDVADTGAQGTRLGKSVARLTLACELAGIRVKEAYLEKLRCLHRKCNSHEQLRSLPFDFFVSVLTDTLLFRRNLGRRMQADDIAVGGNDARSSTASSAASGVTSGQEVTSFLGIVSSVVCDLYLAIASPSSSRDSVFGGAFQADLNRLICLANRCGLAFLDSAKKRQLHQCLLKLMRHIQTVSGGCGSGNAGGASTAGGRMQPKSIKTLIRLLLDIRLHLDRQNLASRDQLWLVEKTVPFASLPRYLDLRDSWVVEFTAWSQDAPQLRELLNPLGKDPAMLRVERQCRCQVTLQQQPDDSAARRCRPKSLLLSVDLRAWHGSHAACMRLLTEVLRAKQLTLEPCEATVQVPVLLQ